MLNRPRTRQQNCGQNDSDKLFFVLFSHISQE
jgi:hypothetical protein